MSHVIRRQPRDAIVETDTVPTTSECRMRVFLIRTNKHKGGLPGIYEIIFDLFFHNNIKNEYNKEREII
jgi:hypothetical protein